MDYLFTKGEINRIIGRFGERYYEKVSGDITRYSQRWQLSDVEYIPSYSANCVFRCVSERYGKAVLKIGKPGRAISAEYRTLREYNGRRLCQVYEADIANGIILEERIEPGHSLFAGNTREQRISIFCALYKDLHISPANADRYPTYIGWVKQGMDYISGREDCKALYPYLKKANDICASVSTMYPRKMLLHGDLHHENILLKHTGEYVIIDPKGVIGDPVFEISRFILNEFDDTLSLDSYQEMESVIRTLANKLHIPAAILKRCLYVETAIWLSDDLEKGSSLEQCEFLIQNVIHADAIMQLSP